MVWIDYASSFDKICEGGKHKTHLCIPLRQGTARDWRGVPKFIDEATTGLDPVVRNEILDIFREYLQDETNSILMSSHITSDLEKIADCVTFIDKGKILLSGVKDEILENHGLIKCRKEELSEIAKEDYISARISDFGAEAMVSDREACHKKYPSLLIEKTTLEEIMLFYVNREKKEWN